MLFVGGPATDGPGIIVGDELKETLRSYSDILKDKVNEKEMGGKKRK